MLIHCNNNKGFRKISGLCSINVLSYNWCLPASHLSLLVWSKSISKSASMWNKLCVCFWAVAHARVLSGFKHMMSKLDVDPVQFKMLFYPVRRTPCCCIRPILWQSQKRALMEKITVCNSSWKELNAVKIFKVSDVTLTTAVGSSS